MKLFKINVTHYAPKDSQHAILAWLIAEDEKQVMQYINKKTYAGWNEKDSEDYLEAYMGRDWMDDNPEEVHRAKEMGLIVESGSVSGNFEELVLWHRGDGFEEVSDLYYGATQYDWEEGVEITPEQTEVLIELKIAEKWDS